MTRSRIRRLLGTLTVGVAALSLAACGSAGESASGGNSDGKTTLTFLQKWPEPQYAPFFEQVVADFEKANPNINVEMEAVGDQPIKEKLQVLASSKQLPDIYFSWAGDFTKKFVRANLAADLTADVKDGEWDQRLAPAGVEAFTYDDKVYGVPMDLDGKFFVYNTKIFQENGLTPPKTLDELYQACDTLKSAGVQPIAFGNQFGWPTIHYLTTLNARYVPADQLDKDYVPSSAAWSHPGYVKALETFGELNQRCLSENANGIPHDDAVAQVQNGKAAMVYVQSLEFDKFTEKGDAPAAILNNWSFFGFPEVPGAEGDQKSLTGAPDGFLVNAQSENKEAAVKFLQFFTSQQNGKLLVEKMGRLSSVTESATETNSIPQLRDALAEIEGASRFDIWLDTVTHAKVASAYLSGGEALVGGSSEPDKVMDAVKDASETAKSEG